MKLIFVLLLNLLQKEIPRWSVLLYSKKEDNSVSFKRQGRIQILKLGGDATS